MKRKILVKVFICSVLMLTLLVFSNINRIKADSNQVTTFHGGQYKVTGVLETNELLGGVIHTKSIAQSSSPRAMTGGYVGHTEANKLYPQSVNIIEVPNNAEVKVVQWAFDSQDSASWVKTTVVEMAENYEATHPGYKVLAGVNGDFFDWHDEASYGPLLKTVRGVAASEGDIIKPTYSYPLTLGIKNDGSTTNYIQGGKIEFTENHILALYDKNGNITEELEVKGINKNPESGEISVYFTYPTNVYTGEQRQPQTFQTVKLPTNNAYICETPMRIVPNDATNLYAKGELVVSQASKELEFGDFGIVTNNSEYQQKIEAAAYVRVQRNIIGDYEGCTSLGGGVFTLLQDGKDILDPAGNGDYRHPRTMIGAKADGSIVLATVDGRQKGSKMYGMTGEEQGALMKHYGCVNAVNLDGGGSTTVIIRNAKNGFDVKNSPSDGNLRNDSNCYLVVMKEADFKIQERVIKEDSITFKLDTTGVDFNKTTAIKCTLNGETKEVVNNEVTFTGLTNDTKYQFAFSYDTADKKDVQTLLNGEIESAKKTPEFGALKIDISGNKLIFTPEIVDPDEALDYFRVVLDGKRNPYLWEPIEVKKDLTGLTEIEFDIVIRYDLNNGKEKVETTKHVVYDLTNPTGSVDINPEVEQPDIPEQPSEDKKKGCKKDLSTLFISILSLGTLLVLFKKRNK